MGFERLKFTKNWNSATDFPTLETSETQVRADMQLLHDESKNALNALMEALEQGGSDVLVRFGSEEVRYIRMNDSGGLEVSSDGVNYAIVVTGSAGGAAPSIHASQHASGGTDPITPAAIGAQPTVSGAATTITGSNLTANRALVSNNSGKVAVSTVTATELGYLKGVTSGIQSQLNSKAALSHASRHASGGDDQITPADIGAAASGHTHTASDVGAVKGTWTIYSELTSLGLTEATATIDAIYKALPNYSELHINVNASWSDNVTPSKYGTLHMVREIGGRAYATFDQVSGKKYFGAFSATSVFSGWNEIATSADVSEAVTEVSQAFVSKAGDTMTGALALVEGTTIGGYTPHHAGNKPIGSYTGNGDSTERTIEPGAIGYGILVWSVNGFALVVAAGGVYFCGNGASGKTMGYEYAKYTGGVLTLATTVDTLNASGITYYYQCL